MIGAGKMGQALLQGLIARGTYTAGEICACTRQKKSAEQLQQQLGIACGIDPRAVVQQSDVVVVALKPHMAERVMAPLQDCWQPGQVLISVMTGVPTDFLEEMTGGQAVAVYRAMPNTPAMVGEGMTVMCGGTHAAEVHDAVVEQIFSAVGRTAWIEQELMNASTGFSGAGPAYVYVFIEAMSDAGVKVGIQRELSLLMAAQTVKGAAEMVLRTGMHPAQLKDKVTTPAGVTIDGLMELEDMNMRSAVIRSVVKATERAEALFKKSEK